jgi:hypothetical protein
MTIKTLRSELVSKGIDHSIVSSKNKIELINMLKELEDAEKLLDNVQVVESPLVKQNKSIEPTEGAPSRTDPEWTEYVLSLFTDKEKDQDGNPKVDGLRRVGENLLGEFNIHTDVVQAPGLETGATVVVVVELSSGKRISGAADVSSINTQADFARHAVATAETRAEGRALRKALLLTKVLTAEEMQGPSPDEPSGNDDRIVTSMITNLQVMCHKQNIDLDRLVNLLYQIPINQMTRKQGLEIATQLRKYYTKEQEVPDEVKA